MREALEDTVMEAGYLVCVPDAAEPGTTTASVLEPAAVSSSKSQLSST